MEEKYMKLAIDEAKKAIQNQEGMAFGAVIVKDGKVLSSAHNSVNKDQNPTSHAEINAIKIACQKLRSKDLSGAILYSTCEPCPMCFTASWWANISEIIFGVSLQDVTIVSDEIDVSAEYLNKKGKSKIKISKGFMKDKCLTLYKS